MWACRTLISQSPSPRSSTRRAANCSTDECHIGA
jgi:hypothetical protein